MLKRSLNQQNYFYFRFFASIVRLIYSSKTFLQFSSILFVHFCISSYVLISLGTHVNCWVVEQKIAKDIIPREKLVKFTWHFSTFISIVSCIVSPLARVFWMQFVGLRREESLQLARHRVPSFRDHRIYHCNARMSTHSKSCHRRN